MPQATPVVSPASISNQVQQLANGSTTGVIVNPATDAAGNASKLALFGATPVVKPTVTGSKGANAALTSLMTALVALGLVVDTTS